MKETIQKLLLDHPKHAVRKIQLTPILWNWVENHCDSDCISPSTKIYTAITGETVFCPCGSKIPRKLISMQLGFRFCGRAGKCSAAREAVSKNCVNAAKNWDKTSAKEKRKITVKAKYGVENIGQTVSAKLAHANTYQDTKKVTAILNKMQTTCMSKYGVANPGQDIVFSQRRATTRKQNCQMKFNRNHEIQKHISDSAFAILNNKIQFAELLLEKGRSGLATFLGVANTTISRYHNIHKLSIIDSQYSTYETEISNYLNSLNVSFKKDRTICKPKELDFLLTQQKFAIEFDGLYIHSESGGKDQYYHYKKTKQCEEQGIHLIHIFEDEWNNKKDICKNIIKRCLALPCTQYAARQCQIRELTNAESKDFLNQNHLQGFVSAKLTLGLFQNEQLLQIMSLGSPRYNKKSQWELLRLASLSNIVVSGGTKKLWAYFLKNYDPISVVSYCDRRWFTGQIYQNLGFVLETISKPTYWYTDYHQRYHRSRFTKKNCIKQILLSPNNSYSEEELIAFTEKYLATEILSLDRIWDCGQDSWRWKKL